MNERWVGFDEVWASLGVLTLDAKSCNTTNTQKKQKHTFD